MINTFSNGFQKLRSSFQSIFDAPKISRQSFIVVLIAAFSLVFIRYLTPFEEFVGLFELLHLDSAAEKLSNFRKEATNLQLFDLIYWTLCRILFYLLIPLFAIRFLLKKSSSGNHKTKKIGQGEDNTGEFKAYQFGDSIEKIDMTQSFKNAQIRSV